MIIITCPSPPPWTSSCSTTWIGPSYLVTHLDARISPNRFHQLAKIKLGLSAGFNLIMNHVEKKVGQVFFVDGPGGTGKTYLYKALLAKVCSMNLIAIATATSGIAASIMPRVCTAHSRFKIPIKLDNNIVCNFRK